MKAKRKECGHRLEESNPWTDALCGVNGMVLL